jgi:hypothetical protein
MTKARPEPGLDGRGEPWTESELLAMQEMQNLQERGIDNSQSNFYPVSYIE